MPLPCLLIMLQYIEKFSQIAPPGRGEMFWSKLCEGLKVHRVAYKGVEVGCLSWLGREKGFDYLSNTCELQVQIAPWRSQNKILYLIGWETGFNTYFREHVFRACIRLGCT